MSTAGIVVIGNEVLSGKVEERNAAFLVRELRSLGVDVRRIAVIPDEVDVIADELRAMTPRFEHVFTSGGVGGTHDDVTYEGIARGLGVPLVREPALEDLLRRHYGPRVNDAMLRMADVPAGARLLGMDSLPFPLVAVANVYVFPGVPEFLRAKFELIRTGLRTRPFVLRQLYVRVGEDVLADLMRRTQEAFPELRIGSYPRFDTDEYKVKITVEARDPEPVRQGVEQLLAGLDASDVVRLE